MFAAAQILFLLSLALFVSAQNFNNNTRHSLAGSIIAGIIVAVAVGLLLLICLAMSVQRRRHGQTILPGPAGRIGGGFVRPMAPSINYNNGVYGAGPYRQSQGAGYGQQGAGNDQEYPAPPRRGTPPPPPPYTGKEDSAPQAGGFAPPPGPPPEANMDNSSAKENGAPQPGGFAPPPGPPPEAHLNNGGRFPWFKGNQ